MRPGVYGPWPPGEGGYPLTEIGLPLDPWVDDV
jgi:hypothetical protein